MLTIHSRRKWDAAPRRGPVVRRNPGSITELFIHYPGAGNTLVPENGWTVVQERRIMLDLQRLHFGNGWSDIGYNHVMFPNPDGVPRIYTARGAQYTPAAQKGHNTGTLAIMVYMGAHDIVHESTADRLRSYVRWADDYAGHKLKVRGHGEVTATSCPGGALREWIAQGKHRTA